MNKELELRKEQEEERYRSFWRKLFIALAPKNKTPLVQYSECVWGPPECERCKHMRKALESVIDIGEEPDYGGEIEATVIRDMVAAARAGLKKAKTGCGASYPAAPSSQSQEPDQE